jgi:site-specific recombinase XerD
LVARLLWEQKVPGSSPGAPTKPKQDKGFRSIPSEFSDRVSAGKAEVHPQTLGQAIEGFLLSRQVGNCTSATLRIYQNNLSRFERSAEAAALPEVDALTVQRHLTHLQGKMRPVSVHQHFRTLRTFFGWCVVSGLLRETPMRGLTMKVPRTLPRVPEDDVVRRLLAACPDTYEGRRNKALVALLADSGLRISEALRLRIEDVNFASRVLAVRAGKGQKDGVGFFGAETAQMLRAWLQARRDAVGEDFLFTHAGGRPLVRDYGTHLLHRLSVRGGLPRKLGPHALRHYAATSILRQTGDLELVRQVLRHESLAMALRYAHLTKPDVSRKFRRASPLDNLRAGR